MKIGYARVSTDDQNLDLQRDALECAGCERLFADTISGAKADRPGLASAIAFARPGDVLVVWRLDRLGRSLPDLIRLVGELEAAGIGFESLTEKIDASTAAGRLVFHVFAALAEFERNLIRERTHAGLAAARARGRKGGRRGLDPDKQAAIAKMADQSPAVVCKTLGISRSTFYKYAPPFKKWRESVIEGMKRLSADPAYLAEIDAKAAGKAPLVLTDETTVQGIPVKEWNKTLVGNFEKSLTEVKRRIERSSAIDGKK
jgi:DNA invertase Pin-like site-specific DNA recombinase